MYEALITDLDGTAIAISSDGRDVDEVTRQTVRRAIAAGKKITCATGREWELTAPIVKALGFTAPCIIEGGTRIIDPRTEQTLWEKFLDAGVPAKVLEIFKAEAPGGLIMHSADINQRPLAGVHRLPDELRFAYLVAIPETAAIAISNRVNTSDYAVAHFTPSWHGDGLVDLHVTHPKGTKQHAIREWQRIENVTQETTIGMGDSGNDMPIFLACGLKVAVGNATGSLKALADYIAPDIDKHPLQHVIDKFMLANETTAP
jgi:HAD superfamily hydrolase (TIGR01484 family)